MTSRGGAFDLAELTGPAQGPVVSPIGGVHGDEEGGAGGAARVRRAARIAAGEMVCALAPPAVPWPDE